ncbi:EndoU domain-containing protein [Sorangium sp. So ce1128]
MHEPLAWIDSLGLESQPFTRPISWPSFKKVAIDMEEVISGHMVGGWRLAPGNKKGVFPSHWTKETVEAAIRQACRNVDTLVDANKGFRRVLLEGTGKGYRIQFWYNKDTNTIETAYPKVAAKCG